MKRPCRSRSAFARILASAAVLVMSAVLTLTSCGAHGRQTTAYVASGDVITAANIWQLRNDPVTSSTALQFADTLGMACSSGCSVDDTGSEQIVVSNGTATLIAMTESGKVTYDSGVDPVATVMSQQTAIQAATSILQGADLYPPNPEIVAGMVGNVMQVTFSPELEMASCNLRPVVNSDVNVFLTGTDADPQLWKMVSEWRPVQNDPTTNLTVKTVSQIQAELAPYWGDGVYSLGFQLVYAGWDEFEPQTYFEPMYVATTLTCDPTDGGAGAAMKKQSAPVSSLQPLDDSEGFPMDDVPSPSLAAAIGTVFATDWTPHVAVLAPAFDQVQDASQLVNVEYEITKGTPPYHVRLVSNLNGVVDERDVAVAGDVVSVEFGPYAGEHDMRLFIWDANNAYWEAGFPLFAFDASTNEPDLERSARPFDEPVDRDLGGTLTGAAVNVLRPDVLHMGDFEFNVGPSPYGGAEPWAFAFRRTDWPFFRTVYANGQSILQQFRYALSLETPGGTTYSLRSNKCVPGTASRYPGTSPLNRNPSSACDVPSRPYAQPQRPSGLTFQRYTPADPLARQSILARNSVAGLFQSSITVDNLPGSLALTFRYQAVVTLCAPNPSGLKGAAGYASGAAGNWSRPLGLGRCPGFVPRIDWEYTPQSGGVPCATVKEFCRQVRGLRDWDDKAFCQYTSRSGTVQDPTDQVLENSCPDGRTLTNASFQLELDTRHRGGNRDNADVASSTSFVKDGNTLTPTLAATMGTKMASPTRPAVTLGLGDALSYIRPIPQEARVLVKTATATDDGDYDNYHQKMAYYLRQPAGWAAHKDYVAFFGCNALDDLTDIMPCMHTHERWRSGIFEFGPGYNTGPNSVQSIWFLSVLEKAAELTTFSSPSALVDGDSLSTAGGVVQNLWVQSVSTWKPSGVGRCTMPCKTNRASLWLSPETPLGNMPPGGPAH
jgi:hypothetical protein